LHSDQLIHRGEALYDYLEKVLGLEAEDFGTLFRAAGLSFASHRLNGECKYRAALDLEIVGHVLSLEDCVKDRSERLALIEDAIESVSKGKTMADIGAAVRYIREERSSRITLEKSPEHYRKSFETMKEDLLSILHIRGVNTVLGIEEIVRFFGMEECAFHANFVKIISELREEYGIDGEAIHHADQGVVAYTFEAMP
jgi:hypothetical protein